MFLCESCSQDKTELPLQRAALITGHSMQRSSMVISDSTPSTSEQTLYEELKQEHDSQVLWRWMSVTKQTFLQPAFQQLWFSAAAEPDKHPAAGF